MKVGVGVSPFLFGVLVGVAGVWLYRKVRSAL